MGDNNQNPTEAMSVNMTPDSQSQNPLKRVANSPAEGNPTSSSSDSVIKPAKFIIRDGSISESGDGPTKTPTSPSKDYIKQQVLKAIASKEFLSKLTSLITDIVTDTVVSSMQAFEPKMTEFDDKIGCLITSVELLQGDVNVVKSKKNSTLSQAINIDNLMADMVFVKKQLLEKDNLIESLNKRIEHLESYSRRNAIRISNIPMTDTPGNDPIWMVAFCKEHLGVTLHISEIGRMHRTGKSVAGKPRDILVKFVSYLSRSKIYSKRAFLSSALNPNPKMGVFFNEHLTGQRASLFYKARQGVKDRKISATWTYDGSIITRQILGKDTPTSKWDNSNELTTYLAGLDVLPMPVVYGPEPNPN